jgi:arsenical pump membrane protein
MVAVAGVLIVVGVLPVTDALAVVERVWPVLLFVVAMTVVTELAADAELFRVLAERTARWARGRTLVLWLLVAALAVVVTVFLSLDTTAVLLTPIVVLLARHAGLPPLPFALTTVWLANTGSLLLPVSNLTNLLAEERLGADPLEFASTMAAPAAVAVVLPMLIIAAVYRRSLTGRFEVAAATPAVDRVLLRVTAVVLALLLPALLSGVPVWIPAVIAAAVLTAVFAVRRRRALRLSLIPWPLLLLASGLFLLVEALHSVGLEVAVEAAAAGGGSLPDLLRLAGTAAVGANAIDNLPAFLALEPVADDPVRLAAVLIGVNAGCLVTPWASLATLLWHQRLEKLGVRISWWRYGALGLVAAPLTVVAATVALWVAS